MALASGLLVALAGPSLPRGAWEPAANSMVDGRWAAAAALLPGRRSALIVGGYSYATRRCVATAERFDEQARRFVRSRGRLTYPRNFATATLLPDGRVLVAGGFNTVWGTLDSAEVYDPEADSFRVLPSRLTAPRELFQATLLTDGRVLLTGGFDTGRGRTQASADLFDPATGTFLPAASMAEDRFGHAAVRLADGRVLVVGGKHWQVGRPDLPLASAEIFDPATGRFHLARGRMSSPRDRPTATLLADGRVLIAGGQNGPEAPGFAELFDPHTETFSRIAAPLVTPRMAHAALLLPDGRVLLAGGWSPPAQATTAAVEFYDPATQAFTAGPEMPFDGHDQAAVCFPDGLALVAGGKSVHAGHAASVALGAVWRDSRRGRANPGNSRSDSRSSVRRR